MNALMVTRLLTRNQLGGAGGHEEGIPFGSVWWFVYAGTSCFLVVFAGIMSGLTLGLMSLGLVDLEILQRSGSPSEKKQAGFSFFLLLFHFPSRASSNFSDCEVFELSMLFFIACVCVCVCMCAAVILPVVQKQHQLLVTLLLCNAAAMEVIELQCSFFMLGFSF